VWLQERFDVCVLSAWRPPYDAGWIYSSPLFRSSVVVGVRVVSIYSIIETAKANGINTDAYLKMLLEELPKRQLGQTIDDLAPWAFKG
jgi:hypothetical protein